MSEVVTSAEPARRAGSNSENISTVRNPWDGSTVGTVALATDPDAEKAIQKTLRGFEQTRILPTYQRAEILNSISATLRAQKEDFARLITAEVGKPISLSRAEVDRAITTFRLAAEECSRINGESMPLDISPNAIGKFGVVRRFPLGVILCINPFNFPLNLAAHKVAPAIAAGNAFILKPAPQAPLTGLKLGEVIAQSGFPPEAFSILPCSNAVAEKLVTDDRIKMLSFTGSPSVGWMLKSKAGKKKVLLELGGNAGAIVDRTADVNDAVKKNIVGSFVSAGQVCIKVQRIFVHESIFDEYTDELVRGVAQVHVGDPSNPETIVGPLIDDAAATRVKQWIDDAVADGAKILVGGKKSDRVIHPTVLTQVKKSASVYCKEIFGPVTTLHKFSTIEEAVANVNDSPFGLQAGIFSNDFKNILYAYQNLQVGGVVVNDNPTFRVDHMPYGGIKDSGFGREGVKYAIEEMTEPKLLVVETLFETLNSKP